jgi:hypothetical protein
MIALEYPRQQGPDHSENRHASTGFLLVKIRAKKVEPFGSAGFRGILAVQGRRFSRLQAAASR